MRYILSLLLGVLLSATLCAQDLIVTNSGDSIQCKITRQKKDALYFSFVQNESVQSTLLPMSAVRSFQYNYFTTSSVPYGSVIYTEIYPHIRIALSGGGSYNTASLSSSISSDMKDYVSGLQLGGHYSVEAAYYFAEFFGWGLKYLNTYSSNEMNYTTLQNNASYSNTLRGEVTTSFVGTYLGVRYITPNTKHALYLDIGFGVLGYKNHQTYIGYYDISGSSGMFTYSLGYDYKLAKHFAVGAQLSYLSGFLNRYDWTDGRRSGTVELDKNSFESLNRLDLSVGVRFFLMNK